ncbi:hypothetical protein ACWCQZ_36080 [Streptomyces sp. NPDC002285]|uniref:hypothetical protein n=1 Tax=Streptomyces sp. NPDC056468 TaxID=3345830 RepID=UPI0036766242
MSAPRTWSHRPALRVVPPGRPGGGRTCGEYPVGHFDVHQGPWQRRALAGQLDFLTRALGPAPR